MATEKKYILVATGHDQTIARISDGFSKAYQIRRARTQKSALAALEKVRFEFLFIDLSILLGKDFSISPKEALKPFKKSYPTMEIVVISPPERIRQTVNTVQVGASNYLVHPLDPEEVKHVAQTLQEQAVVQSELNYLRDRFWKVDTLDVVKTKSPAMEKVFASIRAVAPTRSTVLLQGETGVGKGVMARLIHQHSSRSDGPFISVHCGAIPDTLLESELFGHEKGAFTGAVKRKLGRFEIAQSGTIFLDEIGTISSQAQVKLLQVLQDGTFQRVGGEQSLNTDVRVIAATNSDLKQMAAEGNFRKDLYYRLEVFPIFIPTLKERNQDIELLVQTFLAKLNALHAKEIKGIHHQALEALMEYEWPGNIRELENLVERAHILETSRILTPESFPLEIFTAPKPLPKAAETSASSLAMARRIAIDQAERAYLTNLLTKHQGRINVTAQEAGISTRQLHKLMTRYGLRKVDFK